MRRDREETLIYDALSRVETPAFDLRAALEDRRTAPERPARPLRPVRRLTALAAVCIVLALAVGAAAVAGISGAWSYFFTRPPEAEVSQVGVSQTAGDYTLTLEDAMVDQDGAVFLLALSRADGAPVDPEARLESNTMNFDLLLDGERPPFMGKSREEPVLSPDGTRLYFCMEVRSPGLEGDGFLGREITFLARGVGKPLRELLTGRASLAPLAELSLPELEGEEPPERLVNGNVPAAAVRAVEEQGLSLPLSRDDLFPQYRVLGAWLQDGELAVVISQGHTGELERAGDLACAGFSAWGLVDGETGVQYPCTGSRGFALSDGSWAVAFTFDGAAAEALDRLEVTGIYRADQVLAEGPFELAFQGAETAGRSLSLSLPLETEEGEVTLTGLRLSALGLTLDFRGGRLDGADCLRDDPPVLHFRDGSSLEAAFRAGAGGEEAFTLTFDARDEAGGRIFLDPDQVTRVTYRGTELLLHQELRQSTNSY